MIRLPALVMAVSASGLLLVSVACKTTSSSPASVGRGGSAAARSESMDETSAEANGLDGQWQSRCIPKSKGLYTKTMLHFESPSLTLKSHYYTDSECAVEAPDQLLSRLGIDKNLAVKGTFAIHGKDKNNLTELDLHLQSTTAYIVAQIGPQSATFGKICKKTEVKKGTCAKLSGQTPAQRARELDPMSTYTRL